MLTVSISSLSTDYVQVKITPVMAGYDPTSDSVQFAFSPSTYPMTAPSVWYSGSWVTLPGPAFWAQCLIGPASSVVTFTPGLYQVWVKVTDNPTVPVLQDVFLQVNP